MVEPGPEPTSLELHSLPSEPDCYSEGSAVMNMCVKTEPDDEDISNTTYCTEVKDFGDEQLDSVLHLDDDQIKQETIMVKINEDTVDLQLCSTTEMLCFPSEQLNSDTCRLSKQYKSETDDLSIRMFSQLQKPSCIQNTIGEAAHYYDVKEECADLQVNELSSVPRSAKQYESDIEEVKVDQFSKLAEHFTTDTAVVEAVKEDKGNLEVGDLGSLSRQYKLEMGAGIVKPHSWLQGPSSANTEVNITPHDLLQKNVEEQQNSSALAGNDVQGEAAFEQSVGPETRDVTHKASKESCCDGAAHEAEIWQCLQCTEIFETQSCLVLHMQTHSGEKPHTCRQCGKSFSQGGNLKQHQRVHSGEKPYKCSQCSKSFSYQSHLKRHQLVHSGEKQYKCSECGKSFFRGDDLKQHQRVHSGEKPFKCSDCGKSFSNRNYLKLHQRVHSGEKPYKCSECGICFSQRAHLNRHLLVHSGEKPFKCNECGKSLSSGNYLKLHQRVHSGEKPYKCSECGICFTQSGHLKRHRLVHFVKKQYKSNESG